MRIRLGYPGFEAERALLTGEDRRDLLASLAPCLRDDELVRLQQDVQRIHVSPALLDYVQALVRHTRESPDFANGLSPRAALALVHAARAWALIADRRHVLPEDVQAVLPSVVTHRLPLAAGDGRMNGSESAERLMKEVAIP